VSTKRPDVIRPPPSDLICLTLSEMHVARWTLRGTCGRAGCGLAVKVNIATLIRIYGPDKPWWGERTPCPREGCDGQITYWAQSIRGGSWRSMSGKPSQAALHRWAAARGEFGGKMTP